MRFLKIDKLIMYHNMLIYIWKTISIFQSNDQENGIPYVVYRLLKYNRIKISCPTTIEYLKSDPDYPTLKSIRNFFEDHRIVNYPLKIDKSELYTLPSPFLAYINEKGGEVVLIYSIDKKKAIYADSRYGIKAMSISDFFGKWDGVVFVIEPDNAHIETDYRLKRSDEIVREGIVPFIFFILSITVLIGIYSSISFLGCNNIYIMLSLTHILGLFFSILLFRHELDIKTEFTDKLCNISTKTDCITVTRSKASKIFGNISWADLGIIYFSGGLIALSIIPDSSVISLLAVLTVCSLPYPIFSIFYQSLILKKWCPLCLSVQMVLLTEFLMLMPHLKNLSLSISDLSIVLLIYSMVLIVTFQLKFLIVHEKERDHLKFNLLKIKRNSTFFIQQLKSSERIKFPVEDRALFFGDETSEVTITVFLSLYCSACAIKFNEIVNIIRKKNIVKIQLIFSPNMDELSAKLLKSTFLKASLNNKNEAIELLEKWFKSDRQTKDLEYNNISIRDLPKGFNDMINYNKKLFRIGNIKMVPAVFVEGFPLPSIYSLEDLRYHIISVHLIYKTTLVIT